MSLAKITADNGYTYLTKQVASGDVARGRQSLGDYYAEKGEKPGVWWGAGIGSLTILGDIEPVIAVGGRVSEQQMEALFGAGMHPDASLIQRGMIESGASERQAFAASKLGRSYQSLTPNKAQKTLEGMPAGDRRPDPPRPSTYLQALETAYDQYRIDHDVASVPDTERTRIRTDVATRMFQDEHGRDPEQRELTGFIVKNSRPKRATNAGFDLTFSPVKSVSVMWALADRDVSKIIEECHEEAVTRTLAWIQDDVLYAREGTNGVRQVKTDGLIVAMFQHRDSRAGDPDLHTHCAVANKVRSTTSGKWLTIDSDELYRAWVAGSERYNMTLETLLEERLGVEFESVPGAFGKQPIREIRGVDERLRTLFSKRRASITARQATMVQQFQEQQGRLPTPSEARKLAQVATLATRPGKQLAAPFGEQRIMWGTEAEQIDPDVACLLPIVFTSLTGIQEVVFDTGALDWWATDMAHQVLATVSENTAVFFDMHLEAEATRIVKGTPLTYEQRVDMVATIVAKAQSLAVNLSPTDPDMVPDALLIDGRNPYRKAHGTLYTTPEILADEHLIIEEAARTDGMTVADQTVDVALAASTTAGLTLNAAQENMVRSFSTSGARLQLGLAPAGTGKTTAMRVLGDAWKKGGGNVVGFSHQAVAAGELRHALGEDSTTSTLASLTYKLRGKITGKPMINPDTGEIESDRSLSWWKERITPGTLVIVDEAGMAATQDLAALTRFVIAQGASIRLIGDDRQLAAVGAGGLLRDLDARYGSVTLNELVRFVDPTEGLAGLALRTGDHDSLGWYLDQNRVRAVTETDGAIRLLDDWITDQHTDHSTIMIAGTTDQVDRLNEGAQQWRIQHHQVSLRHHVTLVDGSQAGQGDLIVTRMNNYDLRTGRADFVKNRDRWIIKRIHSDGSVDVKREDNPKLTVTLPADYVAHHMQLGYAQTIAAAQGTTVDRCHVLINGNEDRNGFYVAMTRGRLTNQAYVTVGGSTDTAVFDEELQLRTATEVLEHILDNDNPTTSATSAQAAFSDPFQQLRTDQAIYTDLIQEAVTRIIPPGFTDALRDYANQTLLDHGYIRQLTDEPAWGTLEAELCYRWVQGADVRDLLTRSITERPLDNIIRSTAENGDNQVHVTPARDYAAVLWWRLPAENTTQSGPLSWLQTIPDLATDEQKSLPDAGQWNDSLDIYRTRIIDEATSITTTVAGWDTHTCPRWAAPLVNRDRGLTANIAIWRASMGVPDNDLAPLGSTLPSLTTRAQRAHNSLQSRLNQTLDNGMWDDIVTDKHILDDPLWPVVAARITDVLDTQRATKNDLDTWMATALESPLPDDHPAAALWYRIIDHLDVGAQDLPATIQAITVSSWAARILHDVPADHHADIINHPDWPTLANLIHTIPEDDQELYVDLALAHMPQLPWDGVVPILTSIIHDYLTIADPGDETLPPDPENDLTTDDMTWWNSLNTTTSTPTPAVDSDDQPVTDDDLTWYQSLIEQATISPTDAATPATGERESRPHQWTESTPDTGRIFDTTDDYGPTSIRRIIELNTEANRFYTTAYPGSWAQNYMRERFGTDLADDPRWTIGVTPTGWTRCIEHLRTTLHASDQELIDAGLAYYSTKGHFLDRFHDSVTIAVETPEGIVGFIGRHNPATMHPGADGKEPPKYVNTPTTRAYKKGEILFGADLLTTDTTPVLVEGPFDALAITLATDGQAVGVAPSGTAFTQTQAKILATRIGADPTVIVATDNDDAGWAAAAKDHPLLATQGLTPVRLPIIGKDPGDMYTTNPDMLTSMLTHPQLLPTLPAALLQHHIDQVTANDPRGQGHAFQHPNTLTQLHLQAGHMIAQLTPEDQQQAIDEVAATLTAVEESVHQWKAETIPGWDTRVPFDHDQAQHRRTSYLSHDVAERTLDYHPNWQPHDTLAPAETAEPDHRFDFPEWEQTIPDDPPEWHYDWDHAPPDAGPDIGW